MRTAQIKKGITHRASVVVVAGLLAITFTGWRAASAPPPELPPVDAPLAPAPPGTRFAPPAPFCSNDKRKQAPEVLPPHSTGTHITASLFRRDGSRLIAVWGDPVLWERRGGRWQPAPGLPRLTGKATEVIALVEDRETGQLRIDTRREGSFTVEGGTAWRPLPRPNAPYDANAQALAAYRGTLFVATLNDGLVLRERSGLWRHVAPPVIGTNAPRQFVVWREDLYVRHGNGTVDRFDGRTWTRDVFTRLLPRRQVSTLATEGDTLFLGQWGGWSATRDARSFTHRFPAGLSNLPVTALLPAQDRLFVGTQGRGLAECDGDTGEVRRWHDERHGMGDDWITALALSRTGHLIAGTFVSGAFRREEEITTTDTETPSWQPLPGTQTDCVTGMTVLPDTVFVSLRRGGVRRYENNGSVSPVSTLPEAQCLLADEANRLLWIGTRTGIVALSPDSPMTAQCPG